MSTDFSKDTLTFSAGSGKFKVNASLVLINGGIVATISGGESPHIGAVAIAVPHTSLKNHATISSTSSVITLVGHKDDELARPISEKLAESFNRVVVVVAGVHVDNASKRNIELLVSNCMACTEKAICHLKKLSKKPKH
jgi:hypothetical protein